MPREHGHGGGQGLRAGVRLEKLKCEGGRKEQRWRWEAALDLYTSLVGSGASGRVAGVVTAAWPLREEFPDEATPVSCCGITDMNNT
jgi:hypothetical protein